MCLKSRLQSKESQRRFNTPPLIVCRRLSPVQLRALGIDRRQRIIYVPHDVWLHIALFIPDEELRHLYAVNASFFEIAMNLRYCEVDLIGLDRVTSRKLDHMKDSLVSGRIRRLHIKPWLIRLDMTKPSLCSRLGNRIKTFVDPDFPEEQAKLQLQTRIQNDIKAVMDAVAAFKNGITEYFIDWDEQSAYHAMFFSSFLSPILRHFGHNLRKLSLKIPFDKFGALIPSDRHSQPVILHNLSELELTFSTGLLSKKEIDENFDILLVFVHNVSNTLTSLSISTTNTSAFLDLSRFFRYLGGLSHLRHFSLCIPFDGAHLPDPSTLRKVLHHHRNTLQSLSLTMSPPSPGMDPANHTFRGDWIPKSLDQLRFTQLETLEVSLRPLRVPLNPVLTYLQRLAPTLTSLTLSDRLLTLPELKDVLDIFGQLGGHNCLRKLRILSTALSMPLFDLIAATQPQLEQLDLHFDHIVGSSRQLPNLIHQLTCTIYTTSQLSEVRLGTYRESHHAILPTNAFQRLGDALCVCLPRLQTFEELPPVDRY